jgi:hypothetical protein
MPRFRVTGDVLCAGFVVIEADSEEDLIVKLTTDSAPATYTEQFEIDDMQEADAFRWDGGEIESLEEE